MPEHSSVPLSFRIMPSRLPGRDRSDWINENRQARDAFDNDTLFYDVFRAAIPSKIVAVGPPLQRAFRKFVKEAVFRLDGQPADVTETSQSRRSCTLEITSDVHAPNLLEIEHPSVSFSQAISPSMLDRYKGDRTLFTLSQNNELDWIQDWARFHFPQIWYETSDFSRKMFRMRAAGAPKTLIPSTLVGGGSGRYSRR